MSDMDVSSGPECLGNDEATDRLPTGRVIVEARLADYKQSRPHQGMRLDDALFGASSMASDVVVESTASPPDRQQEEAVRGVVEWLLARQHEDGHWRAALEGDTILESEYLLLLAWLDRFGSPEVPGAIQRIRSLQLPDGGWPIYPGGPAEISASVKAYLVLKLAGHSSDEPFMQRAQEAIRVLGGPWAANSFTRYYLALLGQMPYSACPAVPPEIVLLPKWFPINLHSVSAWSRTMIVPLSLMWTFKPCRSIPAEMGIAELFEEGHHAPPRIRARGWEAFFRVVDAGIKLFEAAGLMPLRRRAVAACEQWMLERCVDSDGLGAIFPPMVWSIIALKSLGYADEAPEVERAWERLQRLVEREADGSTRLEPCHSPVWDTAITVRSLCLATRLPAAVPHTAVAAAVDWLLDREIRTPGDWSEQVDAEPAAWCFEYANRFYPDVDDTAMVLLALTAYRDACHRFGAEPNPATARRLERINGCLPRAVAWLQAMQNSDGGWGAFDRDNTMELLCKVPFADHNAMIDPSSPDLAGRVLEALGRAGLREGAPVVDRAIAYLRQCQEANGSWFGRWGVNYLYGTWQAIEGLRSVGMPADAPMLQRAAAWLESCQQADGGWGESPRSYEDPCWAGRGEVTASQTAWAVAGLTACGRSSATAGQRGIAWLVRNQQAEGCWHETAFTGTGFPKVFYLRYHYYPIYFPLQALARNVSGEPEKDNLFRTHAGGDGLRCKLAQEAV
jgi:squalene-hopene/tetraprenyl-beta-curcumene cyclase